MIEVPLRLVRSRVPAATAAWLVPGGDAAVWLDETAALGVDAAEASLFALPRDPLDPSTGGVLLVPQRAPAEPPRRGRALPMARRGARLYLPADARLVPPVEDAELDRMLPGAVNVFHPAHGLVAFDEVDAIRAGDLIVPSVRRGGRWDRADPGIRVPMLRGVRASSPPSAETVIESGRGDASTQPLDALPRVPGEPSPKAARGVRNWLAQLALEATADLPRTASAPTWVNRVEEWANRQLRESLEIERLREIERLLHLLRADPELGLRFALPVAGFAGRGLAPPTGRLGARRTEFDAGRLGGRPTDRWDLPAETTRDLAALYRSQAELAVRTGRHRRAAYVYAHLLGDLRGAAVALERGGQFREAAALYRDRLEEPASAARCLERGGLLTEAAALYLEIGQRLRAAPLLDRVGRRADAERLWRDVVNERRAAGDPVGAAALLGNELGVPDEALAVLDDGWPSGGQADLRLRDALALLGRLGRGDDACRWVRRARDAKAEPVTPLVGVLAAAATSHPDARCRDECSDTVRVLVGRALSAGTDGSSALLEPLVATDRGDRLLRRDAFRYDASRRRVRRAAVREPQLVGVECRFELRGLRPEPVVLVPGSEGVLVFGTPANRPGFEMRSLEWDGRPRAAPLGWEVPVPPNRRPVVRVEALGRRILVGFPGGGPRLGDRELRHRGAPDWVVATPAWIPERFHGLCAGVALTTWVVTDLPEEPGRLATCHGQAGAALRSVAIPGEFGTAEVPALNVGGRLLLAMPKLLSIDATRSSVTVLGDGTDVHSLVPAPAHLGAVAVAAGESECRLWRFPRPHVVESSPFATGAAAPRVAFLRDGRIAVLEPDRIRLFRRDGDAVRCVLDTGWSDSTPCIAVATGPHERELVVVTAPPAPTSPPTLMRLRFRSG